MYTNQLNVSAHKTIGGSCISCSGRVSDLMLPSKREVSTVTRLLEDCQQQKPFHSLNLMPRFQACEAFTDVRNKHNQLKGPHTWLKFASNGYVLL